MSAGRTPGGTAWWRQRRRERFARAVDSVPDAVPAPLPDADRPSDPRLAGELAVVLMLRRTEDATAPDDAARTRMRARLLAELAAPGEPEAGADPVPADPTPGETSTRRPSPVPRTPRPPAAPTQPAPSSRPAGRARRVTSTRGRAAIAMGAAFCLVLVLSGMTLLLSRHALPGDALYGVRRTVESASLGLTSGDDAKGRKHLDFAADRIGDIEALAAKYPDTADSPVGDYLTAFADFDSDARAGTADLTGYATNHGDQVLGALRVWAQQQAARIEAVRPKLPTPAAHQATVARTLLGRIERRADAIAARTTCYTITSGATDDLGVVPATGRCDSPPGGPTPPSPAVGGTSASQLRQPTGVPVAPPAPTSPGQAPVVPPGTETFSPPPVVTGSPGAPPTGGQQPTGSRSPGTLTLPLPLPTITLPPLLPGLPGIHVGQ